jgi:TPR repeat protein
MRPNGRGIAIDKPETLKWHRLAAEQGNESAQNFFARTGS